jgi:hypothetical protein
MQQSSQSSGVSWQEVHAAERKCLGEERQLLGLSFSGGGIRSATFNLGVAQGLARLGLLARVDYLSTVSGGGYVGGFLQAWLYRCYFELRVGALERHFGIVPPDDALKARIEALEAQAGTPPSIDVLAGSKEDAPLALRLTWIEQRPELRGVLPSQAELRSNALLRLQEKLHGATAKDGNFVEQPPIEFLRQYSNYLTPRTGLFTVDTWTLIAIYLRNLALNGIVLGLALAGLLTAVRALAELHKLLERELRAGPLEASVAFGVVMACGAFSLTLSLWLLGRAQAPNSKRRPVYWGVVVPLLLSAGTLSALVPTMYDAMQRGGSFWLFPVAYAALWSLAYLYYPRRRVLERAQTKRRAASTAGSPHRSSAEAGLHLYDITGAAFLAAALATFLMGRTTLLLGGGHASPTLRVALGAPMVLAILAATLAVQMGLAGRGISEYVREWGSRLMAQLLLWSAGIAATAGVALYGPAIAMRLRELPALLPGLTLGWAVTTVGGLLAARDADPKQWSLLRRLLVAVAPYVFSLGALIAVSVASQAWLVPLLAWLCQAGAQTRLCSTLQPSLWLACGSLLLGAVSSLLSWRIGVNEFSLHTLYRNRLVRCYLGAVRGTERRADLFTGFDVEDDSLRLEELSLLDPTAATAPLRPLFVVNATLNLVVGEKLAWQFRRASSFAFTPLYSGYEPRQPPPPEAKHLSQHAYRPTAEYGGGISLGTAVAISGAALSPNMGARTSPAMAFLMTLFNVRLGWWLGNPRHDLRWKKAGPTFGLVGLLAELLGKASDTRHFVYLSDGGHFENLGIYELVRRRCRYIIASDAGQDGALAFEDLGNAIQKCRSDFGVQIELDLTPLARAADGRLCRAHSAVGRIVYPQRAPDDEEEIGTLVYLKASLSGDEPVDVQSYARENAAFPHQSTTDQWFDEAQFESYRALGEHVASSAFELDAANGDSRADIEALFVRMWQRRVPSASHAGAFSRHGEALRRIYAQLRESPDLRFLDYQFYPEWEPLVKQTVAAPAPRAPGLWLPASEAELRAGFYLCQELIQLMENVYIDLELEQTHDHPDFRGWMNLFRHWSWSGMLRVTWAVVASTMGARFQTFCQRELGLELVERPGQEERRVKLTVSATAGLAELARERSVGELGLNFREAQLLGELAAANGAGAAWRCFSVGIEHCDPAGTGRCIRLPVGFGVLREKRLVYLRIQDHLRNAGMARTAIRALQRDGLAQQAAAADYSTLSEAMGAADLQRFRALFRSVLRERSPEEREPSENPRA